MSNFPGGQSQRMLEELGRYVSGQPCPFAIDLDKCQGMWLTTMDGQKIFDWGGYYGSKLLGHNHPAMSEGEYLKKLIRTANNKVANPDFLTAESLEFYRLVHEIAPKCMRGEDLRVHSFNSGAEAVENMMKYLLILHQERLTDRRETPPVRRFVYFDRAFHGRTVFTLNITQALHDPVATKGFRGFVPGNIQVPFPSIDNGQPEKRNLQRTQHSLDIIEDCFQRYQGEIVAIIAEPLQGAGGHRVASPDFFRHLSELTHKYGILWGFDEIQTAGGQTGSMFAIDQFDLPYPPNAVAVAKKFGNGVLYMLGATANQGILDSTWGGSLADMVRFTQEMKIVRQEKLIEQVPDKAKVLVDGLEALAKTYSDLIFNIRGMGLYQGFTLRDPARTTELLDIALQEQQLLLLSAGIQTIRLRPMLNVTVEDIKLMLQKLDQSLATLRARCGSGVPA